MAQSNTSTQVTILVNGKRKAVPADTTAARLIELLELGEGRLAVEINEDIVPRSRYAACRLQDGDRVEIVHAIGGG